MNTYKDKSKELEKYIDSIPKEIIENENFRKIEENKRVYKEFIEGLKLNKCFICDKSMNSFDDLEPCFHWFTYPSGIRKKNFEKYLINPISYFRLDNYLRWLANSENPITNVNDLKDGISKTSFIETTYKYKNIEWSFSIGYTDKEGHLNGQVGNTPHFHFQMTVDNRIFLKFNDFHIQFTGEDLFMLALLEQLPNKVKIGNPYGIGVGIFEDENNLEILNEFLETTENYENAPFKVQTIFEMPQGQTMSGKQIEKAIEESKKTNKPIGKVLQDIFKDGEITKLFDVRDSVPEIKKRSGKK